MVIEMPPMDATAIEIRALTTRAELDACVQLQRDTWGQTFSDVVPASLLKVTQRVGGVVAGAFDASDVLLGFVYGLTGVERGRIVHWSDMLAVRPEARNLGLGRRLKNHQREVVRELGGVIIYWTYDPLVARNAHFNFNRLGVYIAEYADDMYGTTDSVLHGGMATDRFVVAWSTRDEETEARLLEARRTVDSADCRQGPVATPEWIAGTAGVSILPHCVRVEIPADAETLLATSPRDAITWRLSVRSAMHWGLSAGYTVNGFYVDDAIGRGYYLLTRQARPWSITPR
jgi:predicted GNAT superfamily acetyltransferase